MDEVALGAVTAVWHDSPDTAQRWFELVCRASAELTDGAGWDELKAAIAETAERESFGADVVDQFVTYLESYSPAPAEVVAQWEVHSPKGLLDLYMQAAETAQVAEQPAQEPAEGAAEQPADGADTAPFDEAAWQAYLAQWHGGWDGSEQSWPAFVEGFTYYAPGGLKAAASELITFAQAQPDKVAVLAPYGIAQAPTAEAAPDQASEANEAAETSEQLVDDVALPALELFLAQNPEFAELLAPERLTELLAEVLVEQLDEPAPTSA